MINNDQRRDGWVYLIIKQVKEVKLISITIQETVSGKKK